MQNAKPAPITVGPQEGQSISVVGDTYRIVITGKQTGGSFSTIDMPIPPNGGPGPHSHAGFHESFFVMDGEVEVNSETGTYIARKGAYVVIPKGGVVHDFKNKSEKIAHLLCTVVPAGLEDFFLEIGKPVPFDEFLPSPPMEPQAAQQIQAMAEKYGQKVYPPDYLDK